MTPSQAPGRLAVLRASSQSWKFWLSAALFLVAGVATLIQRLGPAESRSVASSCGTLAFVGAVDLASPATARECPMCGHNPGEEGPR